MKEIDIKEFLKSYLVCERFLHSQKYAKEFFDPYDKQMVVEKQQYEARMDGCESLIQLLEPSDEYTLLHLHYIKGVPVEKCAESMCVSTRTAYRLLSKGHKQIYDLVSKKEKGINND